MLAQTLRSERFLARCLHVDRRHDTTFTCTLQGPVRELEALTKRELMVRQLTRGSNLEGVQELATGTRGVRIFKVVQKAHKPRSP